MLLEAHRRDDIEYARRLQKDFDLNFTLLGATRSAEVAEAIATVAFEHSVDEEYDSPFTQEARRNGYDVEWWEKAQGKTLVGGKMDDIAVIVAFLDEKSKCPAPLAEEEIYA